VLSSWDSFTPFSAVKVTFPINCPGPSTTENLLLSSPIDAIHLFFALDLCIASLPFIQPNAPSPRDILLHSSSSSNAHPSPLLSSAHNHGQDALADTGAAPAEVCAAEDWAHFVDDWVESKFDAASISLVVDHLDWAQPHPSPHRSQKDCGVKRTLFVSLSRVLKLFKSQSRSSLLQRAFYTWHNLLRMRERRRWISCFCQKM
jgi:hypothetical protein